MSREELLSAIATAQKTRSFQIRIVFTPWSEIFRVRAFVIMLNSGRIAVDDKTMMRLRLVSINRRWPEDTDRVVTVTICDYFDGDEFVSKFRHAIESAEAIVRTTLAGEHEGLTNPKKAIRKALTDDRRRIRVVIAKATNTDVLLFMELVKHNHISFTNYGEQLVFEEAIKGHKWSLGGKFSADVLIRNDLPEHTGRRIMDGAHIHIRTVRVLR